MFKGRRSANPPDVSSGQAQKGEREDGSEGKKPLSPKGGNGEDLIQSYLK